MIVVVCIEQRKWSMLIFDSKQCRTATDAVRNWDWKWRVEAAYRRKIDFQTDDVTIYCHLFKFNLLIQWLEMHRLLMFNFTIYGKIEVLYGDSATDRAFVAIYSMTNTANDSHRMWRECQVTVALATRRKRIHSEISKLQNRHPDKKAIPFELIFCTYSI